MAEQIGRPVGGPIACAPSTQSKNLESENGGKLAESYMLNVKNMDEAYVLEPEMADPQYFDIDVDWLSGVTIKPIAHRIVTSARNEDEIDQLIAALKRDLDLVGELAKEAVKNMAQRINEEE